jgi:hypothetical protein
MDWGDNEASYRQQSKLDTTTISALLTLRDPFSTAALLSLRGVRCIAATQWNMDASSNHECCTALVDSITGGTPVAQAVGETGAALLKAYKDAAAESLAAKKAYQV